MDGFHSQAPESSCSYMVSAASGKNDFFFKIYFLNGSSDCTVESAQPGPDVFILLLFTEHEAQV